MLALASAALLCLSSVAPTATPTEAEGPRFTMPAGWLDLSPGAPAESFARLPPQLAAEARKYAAMAIDVDGARDGFATNLNALMDSGRTRVSESSLEDVSATVMREVKKVIPSASLQEKAVAVIDGARCLRLVYDTEQGGHPLRHLSYAMPVGNRTAVLTFTARRDAFDRYLASFEQTANATTGLKEPPAFPFNKKSILMSAFIGAIVGGIVAIGYGSRKKQA